MDIFQTSIAELSNGIKNKIVSATEVCQAYLDQSKRLNGDLNAYITIDDNCLKQAEAVDDKIAKGEAVGILAGVPIAVKDMLCTKGLKTTAASKMLNNFIPPYSATVVNKLISSDAVVIGKCNQDEFAMGSSNEASFFGACKNPWDTQYVPGGSSGGSAVVVSARMAPGSIGTDTGGSIRQPANFCGVVGVKPTYGRVSRYGIVAFASSLDQAGPFANTVEDAAMILESISGFDEFDSTSSTQTVPQWSQSINSNLKGMKVGLPKEYFAGNIDEEVRKIIDNSISIVKDAGAEVVEVSLPNTKVCVPIYYIIATCEASSNLARYDGVRYGFRSDFSDVPAKDLIDFYCRNRGEGFGEEVKRRIMLGTYALSSGYYDAYYKKACQVRRILRQDFINAFNACDVLLSPVTTTPAFKIGERIDDPLTMYTNDIYTTSTNLAGLPGMSVPGGLTQNGLPVGVQLTAGHFEEQKIFNVASAIEKVVNFKKELPSVLR